EREIMSRCSVAQPGLRIVTNALELLRLQMLKALTTYLLSAMLSWMPARNQQHRETADAAQARYETIAADVAATALDPNEPPVYQGPDGRVKTALVLLSLAFWESAFRVDVDRGQCKP